MIFRKRNEEPTEIMLRNEIISSKESTHLGMTLGSRLNWEEHINKLIAKAKRALNTIKVVAGKKWRGDRKPPKKLYSVICQTKIDYDCQCSQIYNAVSAERLKKLDSIHRELHQ